MNKENSTEFMQNATFKFLSKKPELEWNQGQQKIVIVSKYIFYTFMTSNCILLGYMPYCDAYRGSLNNTACENVPKQESIWLNKVQTNFINDFKCNFDCNSVCRFLSLVHFFHRYVGWVYGWVFSLESVHMFFRKIKAMLWN